MKLIVNSQSSLSETIGKMRALWNDHKYLRVTIVTGRDRTLSMNDLSWVWYTQIAKELGDRTPDEVHIDCKSSFGFKILSRYDDGFAALVKSTPRSMHLKLAESIRVSSLMTTTQFKEYLEEIQQYFMRHHGIPLEFPKE